ncbi:hypothetical protein MTO96_032527 [Rhipicephalus appendiculatus]
MGNTRGDDEVRAWCVACIVGLGSTLADAPGCRNHAWHEVTVMDGTEEPRYSLKTKKRTLQIVAIEMKVFLVFMTYTVCILSFFELYLFTA